MPGDDGGSLYQNLLQTWSELLRTLERSSEEAAAASGGDIGPPVPGDPGTEALFAELVALLMTSTLQYWAGLSQAWGRLFPVIERGLHAAREEPARASELRAVLIDELRLGLQAVTDLSRRESERVHLEFERIVRRAATDEPAASVESSAKYWRRWTVKP